MVAYRTNKYSTKIEEVEVDRFQGERVYLTTFRKGKQEFEKKSTSWDFYHQTREEAKEWLIKYYQNIIDGLKEKLEKQQENLDAVNSL